MRRKCALSLPAPHRMLADMSRLSQARATLVRASGWIVDPKAMAFKAAARIGSDPLMKLLVRSPRTFNEKVRYKMVHDRDPRLVTLSDKIDSKEYVAERIGADYVPRTLQVAESFADIEASFLPREYAAKASHASGGVILVSENAARGAVLPEPTVEFGTFHLHPDDVDLEQVGRHLDSWLRRPYGWWKGEWAYSQVKPRILIEQLLPFEGGHPPADYRFYMFDGGCGAIIRDVHVGCGKSCNIYRADGTPTSVKYGRLTKPYCPPRFPPPELPDSIFEMRALASTLSKGMDFVRVDMFELGGKIYVGELTNYPLGGTCKFSPRSFDLELGSMWK